jgi:hypothetical protein
LLLALLGGPLYAHRVALKDGRTVQFEKYRATETKLFYASATGEEIGIPLADVDFDRTQQLNSQEAVPLNLPGMAATNGTGPSLADIARQQQKNKPGVAAKRVVTDDDVSHGSPEATATAEQAAPPAAETQSHAGSVQQVIDSFANKTQKQLASEAAGEVQFPDRDAWEQKLYAQGQRVVKFAQSYLDRTKKLETITDPTERSAGEEAAKNFEWQFNVEATTYTQVATEGAQKAKEAANQPR